MRLGIVIPTLNEGLALQPRLQALAPLRERGVLVVVVDGGSTDHTLRQAGPLADVVTSAPRGRAAQMNAGARAAAQAGVDTLLFLRAGTELPPDADQLIEAALADPSRLWGSFRLKFRGRHPLLPLVARWMNLRFCISGIAAGEQALFVRRRTFEALGGFAPQPLMEDIEFSRRLKALCAPACVASCVQVSGRRWDQYGFLRTGLALWRLRAAYASGVDPVALARRFDDLPRPPAAVAVLATAPLPGLAQAGLVSALGRSGAARVERQLCLQTLATVRHACTGPLTLWCAPDTGHRLFRALRERQGVLCQAQATGDMGRRRGVAMQAHFEHHPKRPWIVVGTDCPLLTAEHLLQAASALQEHDAVLVPSEDGGYVLLGLRRCLPGVFERVGWGSGDVLAQTRSRLREAQAHWKELPALWTVKTPADWKRWQQASGAEPTDLQQT